jgi:hypothetical protein
LALKIFDMSDRCGYPLYAKTSGERPVYLCGRYMQSGGKECNHNAGDGEAALKLTLGFLHDAVGRIGGREAMREKLMRIAERERASGAKVNNIDDIRRLERQLSEAESELHLIWRNWARAQDDVSHEAFG